MSSTDTQAHASCCVCAQVTWEIKEGFLGLVQIPPYATCGKKSPPYHSAVYIYLGYQLSLLRHAELEHPDCLTEPCLLLGYGIFVKILLLASVEVL